MDNVSNLHHLCKNDANQKSLEKCPNFPPIFPKMRFNFSFSFLQSHFSLFRFLQRRHSSPIFKGLSSFTTSRNGVISGLPCDPVVGVTLPEFVFQNLASHANRPAFTCGLSLRSYKVEEIYKYSRSFATALIAMGLKKGEVVGVMLPNLPEYPIILLGVWWAGGVASPISSTFTPDEVTRQCTIAGTKIVVTFPLFLPLIQGIKPKLPDLSSIINVGIFEDETREGTHSFFEMLKSTPGSANDYYDARKIDTQNDLAMLPFSSGTTGPPKAVMLTHSNLTSNARQYLQPGVGAPEPGAEERALGLLPFYHCYGSSALMLIPLTIGAHTMTLPKFDPFSFTAAVRTHRPTTLHVVTPLVQFMLASPEFGPKELESVNYVISGAAPVGKKLIAALIAKSGKNLEFREGYGMTESTTVSHLIRSEFKNQKIGSIGQPIPGTSCKLISEVDGQVILKENSPGELWIKGPQIMKGYYKNEEATKESLTEDGWLKTGDIGVYDEDNCFYIVDRMKELIKVKGLQVSPSELEDILRSHPEVADAAVVGVKHPKFGEAPRAFIVRKKADFDLTARHINKFLDPKIAKHKRLEGGITFVDEIPRALSGKILRRVLKAKYVDDKDK